MDLTCGLLPKVGEVLKTIDDELSRHAISCVSHARVKVTPAIERLAEARQARKEKPVLLRFAITFSTSGFS
jgi:hypothetical protein